MAFIHFEKKDDAGIVRFSNPESMNAFSCDAIDESLAFFEELGQRIEAGIERDVRALILTGEGKAFIAGANIKEMCQMGPAEATRFSEKGSRLMAVVEKFPVPVIAAINGYALGGGFELALAADFIYASSLAKIGLPEVTLGIVPGFGGIQRLCARVGSAKAKELIYTGHVVDAHRAFEMGIVNAVFEPDELLPRAMETAAAIAAAGRMAVRNAKQHANQILGGSHESAPSEAESFGLLFSGKEPIEGLKAFLEKRKPRWTPEEIE
jgi:enoyl-CoA hydratase